LPASRPIAIAGRDLEIGPPSLALVDLDTTKCSGARSNRIACAAAQTITHAQRSLNPGQPVALPAIPTPLSTEKVTLMNRLVYIVGAVVIIVFLLGFFGLR
jgi:hypothetical protein